MLTLTVAASEGGGNPSNTMQQHKSSLHLPSGGTRDFLRYCGDAARQDSGLQNCCGRRDQGGQEDGPFGIEGSHRVVTNTGGGGGGARRNHRGRRRTVDRLTEARGQRGWKATGATSKAGLTSTARRRQGGGGRRIMAPLPPPPPLGSSQGVSNTNRAEARMAVVKPQRPRAAAAARPASADSRNLTRAGQIVVNNNAQSTGGRSGRSTQRESAQEE